MNTVPFSSLLLDSTSGLSTPVSHPQRNIKNQQACVSGSQMDMSVQTGSSTTSQRKSEFGNLCSYTNIHNTQMDIHAHTDQHTHTRANTRTHARTHTHVPAMARLPMQLKPKRVGSSLVNIMTSNERPGLKPCVSF